MNINVNVNQISQDTNIKSSFGGETKGSDSFLETFNKLIKEHKLKEGDSEKDREGSDTLDENIAMSLLNSFLVEPPVDIENSLSGLEMESEFKNSNTNIGNTLVEMGKPSGETINLEDFDLTSKTEGDKSSKTSEVLEFNLETTEKEGLDLEKVKPPIMKQAAEVGEKESLVDEGVSSKVDKTSKSQKGNGEIGQSDIRGSTVLDSKSTINDTVKVENQDAGEVKGVKTVGSEDTKLMDIKTETMEIPKNLDTNFMFNRIQNMFFNLDVDEMGDTLSSENLQNIKDSMVEFMQVSKEGDASVMKVKLYPEELGSINISLKLYKGGLIADIMVESEKIKALFLNSSNLLNRTLVEQDIPVKNINISVNDSFNSFESSNEETNDGHKHQNPKEDLNRNNRQEISTNPLDDMRIRNIRQSNRGVSILA